MVWANYTIILKSSPARFTFTFLCLLSQICLSPPGPVALNAPLVDIEVWKKCFHNTLVIFLFLDVLKTLHGNLKSFEPCLRGVVFFMFFHKVLFTICRFYLKESHGSWKLTWFVVVWLSSRFDRGDLVVLAGGAPVCIGPACMSWASSQNVSSSRSYHPATPPSLLFPPFSTLLPSIPVANRRGSSELHFKGGKGGEAAAVRATHPGGDSLPLWRLNWSRKSHPIGVRTDRHTFYSRTMWIGRKRRLVPSLKAAGSVSSVDAFCVGTTCFTPPTASMQP